MEEVCWMYGGKRQKGDVRVRDKQKQKTDIRNGKEILRWEDMY